MAQLQSESQFSNEYFSFLMSKLMVVRARTYSDIYTARFKQNNLRFHQPYTFLSSIVPQGTALARIRVFKLQLQCLMPLSEYVPPLCMSFQLLRDYVLPLM